MYFFEDFVLQGHDFDANLFILLLVLELTDAVTLLSYMFRSPNVWACSLSSVYTYSRFMFLINVNFVNGNMNI